VYVLCDGELSEVVANHLWLDFDLVKFLQSDERRVLYLHGIEAHLSRVDTNHATNHLRDDNHVTQMGLDEIWLLIWLRLLLRLAELLDESHGLALQPTVEPAAGAGVDDVAELLGGEVKESVQYPSVSFTKSPISHGARTGRGQFLGRRICGTLCAS